MTYAYCDLCKAEISEPTIEEIIEENHSCSECGLDVYIQLPLNNAVLALLERFEALEKTVRDLKQNTKQFITLGEKI